MKFVQNIERTIQDFSSFSIKVENNVIANLPNRKKASGNWNVGWLFTRRLTQTTVLRNLGASGFLYKKGLSLKLNVQIRSDNGPTNRGLFKTRVW